MDFGRGVHETPASFLTQERSRIKWLRGQAAMQSGVAGANAARPRPVHRLG
jgi:hypothetical protein